jgi:membrane protein
MLQSLIAYLTQDLWRIRVQTLSAPQAIGVKALRIILTAGSRFSSDNCYLKASALTFYSLLSIVPVLAALFGIAKGFGLKEAMENEIKVQFAGQKEILEQAISFAHALLDHTQGGLIAGVGVIFLLWTVIKLLGNIELSLNDIWRIRKPRSLSRKFSDYLAILIVCPLFITLSGSLNVALATQLRELGTQYSWLESLSGYLLGAAHSIPYFLVWIVFSFLYFFVPNTKVNLGAGILGGVVAGTLYQTVQWIYITFQIGVASYGAVYGSFAALPLFLVWLQTSWMIVLVGGEIAAALQNVEEYEFRNACENISPYFKRMLSLLITQQVVAGFCKGEPAPRGIELSRRLEIPLRLVREILSDLNQANVLSELHNPETEEVTYQPAKSVELLTVQSVHDTLDHHGTDKIPVANSVELQVLTKIFEKRNKLLTEMPQNKPLSEI